MVDRVYKGDLTQTEEGSRGIEEIMVKEYVRNGYGKIISID